MSESTSKPEMLYLDLLKKCLTRSIFDEDHYKPLDSVTFDTRRFHKRAFVWLYPWLNKLLAPYRLELVRKLHFDAQVREEGKDWPAQAETMVGLRRLDNLQHCITEVLRHGVAGDLIETGVWRGGATILMRAVLKAYGDTNRIVWVADSFQGLPKPDPQRYPKDAGDRHWEVRELAIPLEEVKANFARYGLLDDQVRFLAGWFRDTLPNAPIERLAVLRIDGDMYESVTDALDSLYSRLSVGGYVIVDDYADPAVPGCKQAVDDFRSKHGIREEFRKIDWSGVFWQRLR